MKITSDPQHINLSSSVISTVAGSKNKFEALLSIELLPSSDGTNFTLGVDADIPFMLKAMLGSKLQDAVNQAAAKLAETINAKL